MYGPHTSRLFNLGYLGLPKQVRFPTDQSVDFMLAWRIGEYEFKTFEKDIVEKDPNGNIGYENTVLWWYNILITNSKTLKE